MLYDPVIKVLESDELTASCDYYKTTYSVDGEFERLGSAWMQGGYTFHRLMGDYPAMQLDIVRIS